MEAGLQMYRHFVVKMDIVLLMKQNIYFACLINNNLIITAELLHVL